MHEFIRVQLKQPMSGKRGTSKILFSNLCTWYHLGIAFPKAVAFSFAVIRKIKKFSAERMKRITAKITVRKMKSLEEYLQTKNRSIGGHQYTLSLLFLLFKKENKMIEIL